MIGSAHIFADSYLDKEENGRLQEVVFRWLTSDDISLNSIDAEDPDVREGGRKYVMEGGWEGEKVEGCEGGRVGGWERGRMCGREGRRVGRWKDVWEGGWEGEKVEGCVGG